MEHTYLGIELGSTRIKAVLIDGAYQHLAAGAYTWENRLENGVWTYHLDDVWTGLSATVSDLTSHVRHNPFHHLTGLGISAMMHGYLAFDGTGSLIAPFRTWRNTMTGEAAAALTTLFGCNIPQRWSIAHLYQAMLNREPGLEGLAYLTTLAGYVHWQLTGEQVLGVGDASGMFPIARAGDAGTPAYDPRMVASFNELAATMGYSWTLEHVLPRILVAGEPAGVLTAAGARRLDPSGTLPSGVPLCPPEGDAGTGMVATNSVAERRGNVSAGTSIFGMIVLEQPLKAVHPEIDLVTTPCAKPVAMVHCNNCTSDIDAWVKLFGEAAALVAHTVGETAHTSAGIIPPIIDATGTIIRFPIQAPNVAVSVDKTAIYNALYAAALNGDPDCAGIVSYNYFGGEPITGCTEGRPLLMRLPDSAFTLPNVMRNLIYSALATLRIGMDILTEEEGVQVDYLLGHGGLFKTPAVGARLMAGALKVPVAVTENAGEGGAWGVALLAAYRMCRKPGMTLAAFLETEVFAHEYGFVARPETPDSAGFDAYLARYKAGLPVEHTAVALLH